MLCEGWFAAIKEVKLPPNIRSARICSVHFNEQSFVRGKTRTITVQKRYLLPNAVPTLYLTPTENRALDYPDCRIERRIFEIPIGNWST